MSLERVVDYSTTYLFNIPAQVCIMLFYCTAAVLECPGLEDPPNGMVTVMDNVPGSVAMYICDSGYMLSAQGDRNCERLGERDTQWGGVPPTCTRTFVYTQNLPKFLNGENILVQSYWR